MWAIEGIVAGILGGIFMVILSGIGHRLGILRSNLMLIDGSFVARLLNRMDNRLGIYVLGALVHLGTSAIFGIVYVTIAQLIGFDTRLVPALVPYVLSLWLAMLFVALPIAGQGILGNRLGRWAWAEQLLLHVVFGIVFWWGLGVI
jgi:hypothetical protein